jgi:hypothetical protein
MRKLALLAASALAATAVPMAANAQLVDNGDGTVTVTSVAGPGTFGTATINFDGNVDGTPVSGLTAQLLLTFTGVVSGDYTFSYTMNNTSSIDSRVTGFAFNTAPNITGGTAAGVFGDLITNGNYPNNVGSVEVCLTNNNGDGCAGGGGGGVNDGSSGDGTFTLDFGATTPTTITLSDFFDRYQSIVGVQAGTSGTGSYVPPSAPEPATWAMMLLGFGATGFAIRRARRKTLLTQLA